MDIKPVGDRILVKPIKAETTTKSGIVLATSDDKEKAQGEVVAIGLGEKIQKLNLKLGQKVMFGKYAGDEVEVDKIEYKFLKEEDILGVIQ